MIKFFRQIRKSQLQQSKMSKYFKYAIGEIILVVIGILIALQINNWNQTIKNNNKEVYILKELKKEFQNDSIQLQSFSGLVAGKASDGNQIKNVILKKNHMSTDSLIFKAFFNGRVVLFESYTPTFDELVSTGKLDLIKNDELKKLINSYKSYLNVEKTFLFYEAQKRKEAYNQHLFKYFESQIMTELWEKIRLQKKGSAFSNYLINPGGFLADPETLFHVNVAIGVDRELHWGYTQRTLWRVVSIIEAIDRELKNKS